LKRALSAFRGEELSSEEAIRWLGAACRTATDQLWDDETWDMLSARHIQLARDAGALTVLPLALTSRVGVHLFAGDFAAAAALIEEQAALTEAMGTHLAPYGALLLAAWRGREAEVSELIEANESEIVARGEGLGLTVIQWASAVLNNGLGRHEEALAAAEQARQDSHDLGLTAWMLPELVEAAIRGGMSVRAADALKRLSETTAASGTDWALGIEARSRALLSEGETADALYRVAIDRLGRTRIRVDLARAHLLYGEWLRRENRRLDAREQLRTAHEMFVTMGAEGFAERARRELAATGETVRKRAVETRDELTAQEAQIARLAREGHTSAEIGAQLFLSSRTVDWHLSKVFAKLGIKSRRHLRTALPP
jgi:DNA-binding CsgD family transcriptional regulator